MDYFHALRLKTGLRCSSFRVMNVPFNSFVTRLERCTMPNGRVKRTKQCFCDIGISAWMKNSNRTGVHFLPPHSRGGFMLIAGRDVTSSKVSATFFVETFDSYVWLGILAIATVFMFLKFLDKGFARSDSVEYPETTNSSNGDNVNLRFQTRRFFTRFGQSFQSVCMFSIPRYRWANNCFIGTDPFLYLQFQGVYFSHTPCVTWTKSTDQPSNGC